MIPAHTDALIQAATPSIGDYFRSFYYPATHLSPVDLDQNLPQSICPQSNVIALAQRVVSFPEAQSVFSDPLSHDWLIKVASERAPEDQIRVGLMNDQSEMNRSTAFDSLLRLTMNQRIRQVARDLGIDLVVPEEYVVPYQHSERGDVSRSYFVISQKLNLKSVVETVAHISKMKEAEQIELARKISLLIKNIGLAEASFDNIRFTAEGTLALIDTKPAGLLVATADPLYTKGHSIEKCGRMGLFTFKMMAARKGLDLVSQEVDRYYKKSLKEMSVIRIMLSIICPLIPLVFLVIALINTIRIGKIAKQMVDGHNSFRFRASQDVGANQTHWAQTKALIESYHSAIDGVPFAPASSP